MPGSDFLQLDPSGVRRGGLTDWLVDSLRAAITDGRLPLGSRLPPTRVLAAELGISRGVVVEAYQRLLDEGRTNGDRKGAVVASTAPARPDTAAAASSADDHWNLAPGLPDLSAFPRSAWLRAERDVLRTARAADLGYGDPRGTPALREQLAGWLARRRGVRAAPDEIVVVAGVAQAFALLACVLQARGVSHIALEDPGSRGVRDQLASWGVTVVPVAVDAAGLDVDALHRSGCDAVLVTPAHQFPTGVVLGPSRRRELLDWAQDDRLVIEDDYDAEHRYDRAPVAALQGVAPARVAYAGSASKTLAPALRLGWLVPPPHLLADIVAAKFNADLSNAALPQLTFAHLLASGALDRHLRLVRGRQRVRRDAMIDALRTHLPKAEVHGVAAGLHLVVTLPAGTDDVAVAARARDAGVLVQPLSWHRQGDGPPGLVLGYAAQSPDRIADAVARLARALPN